MWKRIRSNWKALAGVAVAYTMLHLAPNWIWQAVAMLVLAIIVGIPLLDSFAERRLRAHVTRHIEGIGYSVVEIKKWHEHFGVTFMAGGKRRYVRFEHGGWGAIVEWVDGPPEKHVA